MAAALLVAATAAALALRLSEPEAAELGPRSNVKARLASRSKLAA
jgi:hypothetical protein